jgi:putative ABC transport system permease protein
MPIPWSGSAMKGAFRKSLLRKISGSWGRFLAILGIVALGCGFFAGLNMVGRDMRLAGDAYYDDSALYDIRLVSTLGFTDRQMDKIRDTEGVEDVMPSFSCDAMVSLNNDEYTVRISSLPEGAAEGTSSMNKVELVSGAWPEADDECVMSADVSMRENLSIGDTVTVLYGTGDIDSVLTQKTFRVTGLVRSADYVDTSLLGTTALGSGKIEQYLFVPDGAFADDLPYTQVYVTVTGARAKDAFSDGYADIVDRVETRLEDEAYDLAQDRLAEVKDAAQKKVDESRATYESEKADAESHIAQAQSQLDDALATLEENRQALEEGKEKAADGWSTYWEEKRQAEAQLASAKAQLEASQSQLDDAEAQLGMTEADIDAARQKLEEGKSELEAGKETWEEKRSELVQAASDMDTIQGVLTTLDTWAQRTDEPTEEEISALADEVKGGIEAAKDLASSDLVDFDDEETKARLEALADEVISEFDGIDLDDDPEAVLDQIRAAAPAAIADVQEACTEAETQIASGIDEGDTKIADAERELADNEAKLDEAQSARTQIDAGRQQLEEGWARYFESKKDAEAQLASAYQQLVDADSQIASGESQLEDGYAQYEEGVSELVSKKAEAESRFADAAQQLQAAQDAVDGIAEPSVYVLDRTKGVGQVSYGNDASRIDAIAQVFPLFFFLVAALVALTSMTRMVEDDRIEIGTYKALGYSAGQIAQKYLFYAGAASLLGAVLGTLFLSQLLPAIVTRAYGTMYVVPSLPFPLPIDVPTALLACLAGVSATLAATSAAVWAEMREVPAALMLPKAPPAGKRILLEHIRPVWHHMSFLWKVTFRNLFRYKRRLVMTLIGIAGCCALLLTGLGVRDAISDIVDKQYGDIWHSNVEVSLDEDATEEDKEAVESYLADAGAETSGAWAENLNMQAGSETASPLSCTLIVPEDPESFSGMVTLRERTSGASVPLDEDSVLVSEKLASELGLSVGDAIGIYDQDDIGNAAGEPHALTIAGIFENYLSYYVIAGQNAYTSAFGAEPKASHLYASAPGTAQEHRSMAEEMRDLSGVSAVSFNDDTISSYREMLATVDSVMVVLVVAAALLAFIVLYNLTNINIQERIREIASLKVLGFTRHEVASYVFREIVLLSALGAAIGLAAGIFLEQFVIVTAEVDFVMFGRDIHPASFAIAFGMTMVFTLIVMAALSPKLAHIDMVESLKSVD